MGDACPSSLLFLVGQSLLALEEGQQGGSDFLPDVQLCSCSELTFCSLPGFLPYGVECIGVLALGWECRPVTSIPLGLSTGGPSSWHTGGNSGAGFERCVVGCGALSPGPGALLCGSPSSLSSQLSSHRTTDPLGASNSPLGT